MTIVGILVFFYLVAVIVGRSTKSVRPGTYMLLILVALAQAAIVLVDLYLTPIPKP